MCLNVWSSNKERHIWILKYIIYLTLTDGVYNVNNVKKLRPEWQHKGILVFCLLDGFFSIVQHTFEYIDNLFNKYDSIKYCHPN